MNETVTVIIPTYNEEKSIHDCLDSIKKQDYSPLEIIVVDDGSTDATRQIIKKNRIKLLSQLHRGPAFARNLGAKHAKGEILVFLDADMTLSPSFITNLTKPIRDGKTMGTFSMDELVLNWNNIWSKCWNRNNGSPERRRIRDDSHDQEDFRAIKASIFKKSGGFDPIGYTDSRTLITKLGFRPEKAENTVHFHRNPETLKEVFVQARWIGRRKMRWGLFGQLINLARHSLPFSVASGIIVSIRHKEPRFFIFKLTYDLAFSSGIMTNIIYKQTAR